MKLPVGPAKPPRESIHARKVPVSALFCCLTSKNLITQFLGHLDWSHGLFFLYVFALFISYLPIHTLFIYFFLASQPTFSAGVQGVRRAGRGLSLCDVTNLSPAAFRKFCSGSRPTEGRSSTPVPARKRRCTMAVNYTEPSLHAWVKPIDLRTLFPSPAALPNSFLPGVYRKLRRGDKFTDLQFLRSPVFKQKSKRNSVRTSGNSSDSQKSLKYNEAFVGCG